MYNMYIVIRKEIKQKIKQCLYKGLKKIKLGENNQNIDYFLEDV